VKEKFRVLGGVPDGYGLVGDVAGLLGNTLTGDSDDGCKDEEAQEYSNQHILSHGPILSSLPHASALESHGGQNTGSDKSTSPFYS